MTLAEVADATGGRLDSARGDEVVTSVVADSREVVSGSLFVAICGERVDGHEFAGVAYASGAAGLLAAREVGGPAVIVDDPVAALGQLAHHLLGRLDARVVAVTGSSGKTSTKDLIAQVVDPPAIAPVGSYNTEVGLPLTVLRADTSTRTLVLEMGMRGLGHIRALTRIARPHVAVVTNVGTAHLELLGSREGIAQAKGEIVEALPADGVAILNADDDYVAGMRTRTGARVMTYGISAQADVRAESVVLDERACPSFVLCFGEERGWVTMSLHGMHNVSNALAAAAVGFALGLDMVTVTQRLAAAQPRSKWRMEVTTRADGVVVINDAYNANPDSMRAGLDALAAMGSGRRTWAVLGEMREIGAGSADEHRALGAYAAALGLDRIVAVGEGARPIVTGCSADVDCVVVNDPQAALEYLSRHVAPGDVILIKASRSIGLDWVADGLLEGRTS